VLELPFQTGAIRPKLNEPSMLDLGDITGAPVGSAEANIRGFRAEHVDLAQ
jgi:hypothetical protein